MPLYTPAVPVPGVPLSRPPAALNVAQAVLICCYELFVLAGQYAPPEEKSPEASSVLRERMFLGVTQ